MNSNFLSVYTWNKFPSYTPCDDWLDSQDHDGSSGWISFPWRWPFKNGGLVKWKTCSRGREIIQAKVCIIRNRKANREQMWPSEVKSVLFPRPRCCCWVHWPVSRSNKRRNESRWLDSRLVAAPSWLAAPSFLSFFLKVDLSTFFLLAGPLVPLSFLSLSTSVGDWANGRQ